MLSSLRSTSDTILTLPSVGFFLRLLTDLSYPNLCRHFLLHSILLHVRKSVEIPLHCMVGYASM